MSEFATMIAELIRLHAISKAAESQAAPLRAKATAMAVERYIEEGSDRWQRPDGLVSLVKPSPYVEVSAPETVCDWLNESGHGDLVRVHPVVVDGLALTAAVVAISDDDADGEKVADLLLRAVDLRRQPVADWHEHIQHEVTDHGTLVSADGEPIPGCRLIKPPVKSVSVRPDKALVEAEQQRIVGAS